MESRGRFAEWFGSENITESRVRAFISGIGQGITVWVHITMCVHFLAPSWLYITQGDNMHTENSSAGDTRHGKKQFSMISLKLVAELKKVLLHNSSSTSAHKQINSRVTRSCSDLEKQAKA